MQSDPRWRARLRLAAAASLVLSASLLAVLRWARVEPPTTLAPEPPAASPDRRAALDRPPPRCVSVGPRSYCESECRGGRARACLALGHASYRSPAALDDFERGCDLDDASACNLAGVLRERGPEPLQLERASALYRKACWLGHGWGCCNLGLDHVYGLGVDEDHERAFALFSTACEGGSVRACNLVAAAHEHGLGTPVDLDRAMSIYAEVAAAGEVKGAHNLGQLQLRVAADHDAARESFERGCALAVASECESRGYGRAYARECALTGAQSCVYLALLRERGGEDGRAQRARAASLGLDVDAFAAEVAAELAAD